MFAATPARGTARLWIVTLALVLAAAPAAAQCVITGPGALCNGSAQLCGPSGNYAYTWSGPNGFLQTTECVTVTEPGTYMLSVIDMGAGRFLGMCSKTVAAGSTPPAATIEGPASACDGESVELCGPDLGYGWLWTGPNGTATTRCVTASGPGTWTLALVDLASGCAGAPATHEIQSELCSAFSACPRPPAFWANGCRKPDRFRYTPEQMASFAACASDRSALLAWDAPLAGACATLNPARPTLRDRALRQVTGVWMNVCSWESRIMPQRGAAVGVDPSATFLSESGPTSVSSWLGAAESELLALAGQPDNKKSVRDAYRAIIRDGWKLNHAEGLDSPCQGRAPAAEPMRMGPAGDEAFADEPLEAEMMWELEQRGVSIERPSPNPMTQSATVAFTVGGGAPQQVSVSVHDLAGRRIAEIVSGSFAPGRHTASWNGRSDDGSPVRPGMYFVRARGDLSETRTTLTVVR